MSDKHHRPLIFFFQFNTKTLNIRKRDHVPSLPTRVAVSLPFSSRTSPCSSLSWCEFLAHMQHSVCSANRELHGWKDRTKKVRTFSSNCEYLSVSRRNISSGGTRFCSSFSACSRALAAAFRSFSSLRSSSTCRRTWTSRILPLNDEKISLGAPSALLGGNILGGGGTNSKCHIEKLFLAVPFWTRCVRKSLD